MCILNLYSTMTLRSNQPMYTVFDNLLLCTALYNPIAFKSVASLFCFSKIAYNCTYPSCTHKLPQSFSTIEYLVKNSFQIQSCDSYVPKISRGSITPDPGPLAGKFYICVLYMHTDGECILAFSSLLFIVTVWTL